jgi:hypothetical protein
MDAEQQGCSDAASTILVNMLAPFLVKGERKPTTGMAD